MGEVWLAEQHGPARRQVALKIIKLGMDTGQFLARLEVERQSLTFMNHPNMNHPNIARFLDAEASDPGRPRRVEVLRRPQGRGDPRRELPPALEALERFTSELEILGSFSE